MSYVPPPVNPYVVQKKRTKQEENAILAAAIAFGTALGALATWGFIKYYQGCGGKCVCGSACTCGASCSCALKSESRKTNQVTKGCAMNNGGVCSCTQQTCQCSPCVTHGRP